MVASNEQSFTREQVGTYVFYFFLSVALTFAVLITTTIAERAFPF